MSSNALDVCLLADVVWKGKCIGGEIWCSAVQADTLVGQCSL